MLKLCGRYWFIFLVFIAISIICVVYNQRIFYVINGNNSYFLDRIMLFITHLGDGLFAAMICFWLLLDNPRRGIACAVALILVAVTVPIMKEMFSAPRPAALLDNIHIVGRTLKCRSFPSGHTATALAVAVSLQGIRRGTYRYMIICLGLLIGISRIYVGAHFPVDVIVGIGIGIICGAMGFAVVQYFGETREKIKKILIRTILTILIIIGTIAMAFFYNAGPDYMFFSIAPLVFGIVALVNLLKIFGYGIDI